ncbi:MAG: molybdopterin cofactor-binding domain-containing protein [Terriglobia bacterium]
MNGHKKVEGPVMEPERYELNAPPAYHFEPVSHFELDRRDFFRILGGGLLVVCVLRDAKGFQESGGRHMPWRGEGEPKNISSWLHIGESGKVTVFTGKVEVGQNIRTSLTQAVAEELKVVPANIQMVMGDTSRTPFDMGTFGSRTTPTMNPQLRRAASAARDVLLAMAAKRFNVDSTHLVAADGKITNPATHQSIGYGELLHGQQLAEAIPAVDPLEPATEWKVMGTPLPKVDGVEFVTGRHRYPSDQKLPGMWFGKVLRPASYGATLTSLDTKAAEALGNVKIVHDGDFVGVAAPTPELAAKALAAIRAEWKPSTEAQNKVSNQELFEFLKQTASRNSSHEDREPQAVGSMQEGLAKSAHRLQRTYTIAYIQHAPLEPRAALAVWKDGQVTAWTGTQRPFGVQQELAEAFRIPKDHVRVEMPDTGGAYGGKHTGEAAVEAARLAKAVGRSVKLVWTREEEFTWAYFRPAGVIEINSGISADGKLLAWEYHNYNSGGSAIATPYDVPNQLIAFHPTKYPLRQGSYRSLAATANHFARESHMDDMAHLAQMDPLKFRLANLKDERLKAVFVAAAEKFGWGREKPSRQRGFGIGGGVEKGGYVATCAEVEIERSSGSVHVARAVTAFDCGAVVNPDGLRNQVEGADVMGLGGGLFEAIEFSNGRILNPRFSAYRVPRFSDLPQIEVVLVDRKDQPSAGAGETPIDGIAPAVGNAIFSATGVRLTALPMVPTGLRPQPKAAAMQGGVIPA